MANRVLTGLAAAAVALPLVAFAVSYAMISTPTTQDLPLPEGMVGLYTPRGTALLRDAEARTDHSVLTRVFEPQEKRTWCGVASSVAVLEARGATLDQPGFFTDEVTAIRSWLRVTFGGIPLPELGRMIAAHGAIADVHHAADESVDAFRAEVRRNLGHDGDWLIVNYDRAVIGEAGGGHISPLSAYDADTDKVLLLDTASYKYPPHWVPVADLFSAMRTTDPESGHSRGWVIVR